MMKQAFKEFYKLIKLIDDDDLKESLNEVFSSLKQSSMKMKNATKFIDFFVHDILDYTILNKDEKNFTKNITLFNMRSAVEEIL